MAQQAVSTSPSVVLVLKLVSNTHVKPTTGIVVSNEGHVLVSSEFVTSEGELVVLDGGTDILSNGRPASVLEDSISNGLAIISVEGLKRPGIKLSANELNENSILFLEAFPPAENIAKGDQPLRIPVGLLSGEQGTDISVSPETPLPYVSGAIIDQCGNLSGISLSSGPQSLASEKPPLIMFSAELNRALVQMQMTLPHADCTELSAPVADTPDSTDSITSSDETEEPAEPKSPAMESESITPAQEPVATADKALPSEGVVHEPKPQVTPVVTEPPSIWRSVPLWLPLLGALVLGVILWKAIFFFRLNKSEPEDRTTTRFTRDVQPASDEPVTAPLDTGADTEVVKPRTAPVVDFTIPAWDKRPEGCDGVLLVEGFLDAETDFKRFCFVNTAKVNITIGRGDSDINIEHAAISRTHVRIESNGDWMTISDLGSRNGTFIGDVPCLPGEVMYIDASDEILLGDVKLNARLVKQEAEWA